MAPNPKSSIPQIKHHAQKDAQYPHQISQFLQADAPQSLFFLGQDWLWPTAATDSIALICSAKAPAGVLLAVHDLAQQWRQQAITIISGFHSPVEREAFTVLLRGPQARLLLCPARSLPRQLPADQRQALASGRLGYLSPFGPSVRRASKRTARTRNRLAAALAGQLLVAHARPGSQTFQLAQEALAWGKPVFTLDHPENQALLECGVRILFDH